MALAAVLNKAVSIRLARQAFGLSQTCDRYQAKLCGDNGLIAGWLVGWLGRPIISVTEPLACVTCTYATLKGSSGTINPCTVFIVGLN